MEATPSPPPPPLREMDGLSGGSDTFAGSFFAIDGWDDCLVRWDCAGCEYGRWRGSGVLLRDNLESVVDWEWALKWIRGGNPG